MFVKHSSSAEVGTSRSSMNRTCKTNAAKDVHNHYNEYKECHQCEVEAHICASFMQMLGMKKADGMHIEMCLVENSLNHSTLMYFL